MRFRPHTATYFFPRPVKSKQKMALKFTPAAGRRPTYDDSFSLLLISAVCRPLDLQVGSTLLFWLRVSWYNAALYSFRGTGFTCVSLHHVPPFVAAERKERQHSRLCQNCLSAASFLARCAVSDYSEGTRRARQSRGHVLHTFG